MQEPKVDPEEFNAPDDYRCPECRVVVVFPIGIGVAQFGVCVCPRTIYKWDGHTKILDVGAGTVGCGAAFDWTRINLAQKR